MSSENAVTRAEQFATKRKIISNQQLAEELKKQIIRKFERLKLCSSFKDDSWVTYIAEMQ